MDSKRIREIVAEHATVQKCDHPMVIAVVEGDGLTDEPDEEVFEKIATIEIEMKPSTPYDDDTYWAIKSPFNGMWYLFAACAGGNPTRPVEVSPVYPSVMRED